MAEYIPIFLDWIETTEGLSDSEKGRLIDALVLYARGEDWQDLIKGNERFAFPFLRGAAQRHIDYIDAKRENGRRGGKVLKQTQAKLSKAKRTEADNDNDNEYDTDTDYDNDTDKDNDTDAECVITRAHKRFTRPTVEQVREYCDEKGYNIDAQYFVDYYEARGWKLKQGPMKDWQAAIRTWVKNDYGTSGGSRKTEAQQWMDIAASLGGDAE